MSRTCLIQRRRYFDSMFLVRVTQRLKEEPEIAEAAVVMGTPANVQILQSLGFPEEELRSAGPDDLVIVLAGEDQEHVEAALAKGEAFLSGRGEAAVGAPKTLDQALAHLPEANIAGISLPGHHAIREAKKAVERGLNVFLFSSGIPVEEEVGLNLRAREGGVVMGPDCGTAIIAGIGLGFANVVRRGPIGLIAASGTGAQEFSSLVHRAAPGSPTSLAPAAGTSPMPWEASPPSRLWTSSKRIRKRR